MNTLLRRFFILAAFLLCCTALANAYDAQIDGIYYNFDKANGTATVTSGDSKYEGDITIPAKVTYESKEYIVTSIGASAFYENYALASITIPSGVTSIGASAFYKNYALTSITIPSAVTSIGASAFYQNYALTSITIPSGVTSIGASAFYMCLNLASITIPSAVTSIGDNAFAECDKLASVTFEEGSKLESIGASAFYQNYALTSITIPSGVTSIGAAAFYQNYALTSITIPSGVTSIGDNAFADCRNLAEITVNWVYPKDIPEISSSVFTGVEKSKCILYAPLLGVYDKKEEWKDFTIHAENNNIAVKKNDGTIKLQLANNDNVIEVNEKDMTLFAASQDVSNVKSITYMRDFTNVVGKWQAWFVPFEAPLSVLNDASIDAAEIAGILLNDEGETIVAFKKMDGGTMKANTPYVVRLKADATNKAPALIFENVNLKTTEETSFTDLSSYDKFTFTGNYESKHVANSYALNTEGEFQKMDESVNLKPMRFSLAVTQRDDSPYGSSPKQAAPRPKISFMIMGDEELQQDSEEMPMAKSTTRKISTTPENLQPTVIYDLRGRKVNRIQSKQVYIINGKNYIAR